MKEASELHPNKHRRFPVFSGVAGPDGDTMSCQIGQALRPFDDGYFNLRLWMFPRTQFHLVRSEHMPSEYRLYRKMRTEKYGQVVFEDLVGEGVVYTCRPQFIAISLSFPRGKIYLRRYAWNSEVDVQDPDCSARPKLRVIPGFKSIKSQTPLENA